MKKIFKSSDITCGNCANLIKSSLADDYGQIEVNLETEPKEVTVEIKNDDEEKAFKNDMNELGFKIIHD